MVEQSISVGMMQRLPDVTLTTAIHISAGTSMSTVPMLELTNPISNTAASIMINILIGEVPFM